MAKAAKEQIISVWCPNCGIPRTAAIRLKKYLKAKKKVVFACHSCGFVADICVHSTAKGKPKEDEAEIKLNDLVQAQKTIRTLKSLGGMIK
jgi:predicted RNA-binding Zn-ribbon protein involved in translation (DUF1610 family)